MNMICKVWINLPLQCEKTDKFWWDISLIANLCSFGITGLGLSSSVSCSTLLLWSNSSERSNNISGFPPGPLKLRENKFNQIYIWK